MCSGVLQASILLPKHSWILSRGENILGELPKPSFTKEIKSGEDSLPGDAELGLCLTLPIGEDVATFEFSQKLKRALGFLGAKTTAVSKGLGRKGA